MDRILDLGKGSHKLGREDSNCVNLSVFLLSVGCIADKAHDNELASYLSVDFEFNRLACRCLLIL